MMVWPVSLILTAAMVGLPLSVGATAVTAALAGLAATFAVAGLWTRASSLLTAAAALGLVEELAAVLSSRAQPGLWPPLLLGIVVYLLLDVGTFMKDFHGVSMGSSVYRIKAAWWGETALASGLVGLALTLAAAAFARPWTQPLFLYALMVIAACIAVGAVVAVVWLRRDREG